MMKVKLKMFRAHGLAVVLSLFLLSPAWRALQAGQLQVDPGMDSKTITAIIQGAAPADTVFFEAGSYQGNYILEGLHGGFNQPVVILGAGRESCIIDGGASPGSDKQQQAFVLENSSWISIEGFTILNCWTDLILALNSNYISVRNCRLEGGRRALMARGRGSHHFLVEACSWEQDPRVWTHEGDFSWDEIHHGIHVHYNGSLFQGKEISGAFVLRDNVIRNTFNAFRLSLVGDGTLDRLACSNGEIYRNRIYNTSDNVLEPEIHAHNLHFYHNHMINGHAFVSITEVKGGEIYIYGNTAVSLPDSDDGWTIFKISSINDALERPLYIFNNSWQVDFDMVGSPRRVWENNHVMHFNNACYSEASDTFGIYNLGRNNLFDYDCSNVPFPALLTSAGFETHGLVADPGFRDAHGGDFRLKEGSPCIDRGWALPTLLPAYAESGLDIGAYQGEELTEGPPFRHREAKVPLPWTEAPRLTRHRVSSGKLQLWFSTPLDPASLTESWILECGRTRMQAATVALSEDGYRLDLAFEGLDPENHSNITRLMPASWPLSLEGKSATSWAATLPLSLQSGEKRTSLQSTRSIADKVIRETSFESELQPLEFNGGIASLFVPAGPEGSVSYAQLELEAAEAGPGILGFSHGGAVKLFLNGSEIYTGGPESEGKQAATGQEKLREYTYNRYKFARHIPVNWKEGRNVVLLKALHGDHLQGMHLLPLNELDEKDPAVNLLAPDRDMPHAYWRSCGPWITASAEGLMETEFGPETYYADHYIHGDSHLGWQLPALPLIRTLKVPETASYVRDPYSDWHYANGGTMLAILSLYELTGDHRYLNFVQDYADNMHANLDVSEWQYRELHAMRSSFHRYFRMTMLDDSGGPALPLVQLKVLGAGNATSDPIIGAVYDYVMEGQERLDDQTFSRPEPEAATIWADDLFMAVPFLLRMAKLNNDPGLYDEVARQVLQFNTYLEDGESGLYFHGWYNGRKENTPVRWGRANGWVVWATTEALIHLPENHRDYKKILKVFQRHMEALATVQDPSGLWHQVLDHPETYLESSCTAMFTLGMARGVRYGWLDEEYREKALRGWSALQEKILVDGTVKDICRGTGIGEDVAFYQARKRFDHDPRGLGAMITAGCEVHLLQNKGGDQ